jgi:hypothetical protein
MSYPQSKLPAMDIVEHKIAQIITASTQKSAAYYQAAPFAV